MTFEDPTKTQVVLAGCITGIIVLAVNCGIVYLVVKVAKMAWGE